MADADVLSETDFDPDASVLTRRQAAVLALRAQGLTQQVIADRLGTSRANVAGIEASARANVDRARETVAFVDALEAPVQISVPPGTDLYDVPARVYDAGDEAGVKVNYTAPELMNVVRNRAGDGVHGRQVTATVRISVTREGELRVRCRGGE